MTNLKSFMVRADEKLVGEIDSLASRIAALQIAGRVSRNSAAVEALWLGVRELRKAVERQERQFPSVGCKFERDGA